MKPAPVYLVVKVISLFLLKARDSDLKQLKQQLGSCLICYNTEDVGNSTNIIDTFTILAHVKLA